MMLLLLSLGSDECKQTMVIVGQLKVVSIKTPEKNPSKREIFRSENVKWGRAHLNVRSLCSEKNQIDLRDLIGEKERGTF